MDLKKYFKTNMIKHNKNYLTKTNLKHDSNKKSVIVPSN